MPGLALPIAIAFAAGCSPEPDTTPPPPPPPDPAPSFRTEHVQVRSGMLDWSAYRRWVKEPPSMVQVERIDRETRNLLARKVTLAEALLAGPQESSAPTREIDVEAEIARIRSTFPPIVTRTYYDHWGRIEGTYSSEQHLYYDDYRRRFERIGPVNLEHIVAQLSASIERDFDQVSRNVNPSTPGGRRAYVNQQWLQNLRTHLQQYTNLIARIEGARSVDELEGRRLALAQWQAFEESDLPILKRLLVEQEIARYDLDEDRFSIEGAGELLIHFRAGSGELFYPIDGAHRFRIFDERRETHIRRIEIEPESDPAD